MLPEKMITGGCYCGDIRYSAEGPVLHRVNCHCANCRRAAGAQSVAWITVRLDRFRWDRGEAQSFRTDTHAWRTFCDRCGTSLTYRNDERPDEVDLTIGSLDQPDLYPPTKDIFPEERVAWVALVPPTGE